MNVGRKIPDPNPTKGKGNDTDPKNNAGAELHSMPTVKIRRLLLVVIEIIKV